MTTHYIHVEQSRPIDALLSIFGRKETPAQKLWREVYVAKAAAGNNDVFCQTAADAAVKAFRERQL